MSQERHPFVHLAKALANLFALVAVFLPALTCWMAERLRPGGDATFGFWSHVMALLPGPPGAYLRRAFYHLTLRRCSLNCSIGFGALFSRRQATVEDAVYIGPYAVVGSVRLRTGSLIGTRASLLSGSAQHELREDGRWAPTHAAQLPEIEVGPNAWIGEAAIIMANVGPNTLIAAGSVVSSDVPEGVVVAGNPARFVRKLERPAGPIVEPLRPVGNQAAADAASHFGFIDWLKCLGMLLIVYGHVAAWAPLAALPPIYSKQLGVAFFLFIVGFSLSRETRGRWHVAFNRLFEVYFFGLALAVFMSVVMYATHGTIQKSNYAPLLGGMNILFNFFPANPTTWYFGTYIHVILIWALVAYRIRVSAAILIGALFAEVAVRVLLTQTAGALIAYMALPNWSTVFLLGCWYAQRRQDRAIALPDHLALGAGLALVAGVWAWSTIATRLPFSGSFPFMELMNGNVAKWGLLTSAMVSMIYLSATWLTFLAVAPLPVPRFVSFVARNTLVIFLAHMPVYYALQPALKSWGFSRPVSSTILMLVCVPGLALLSEALHRAIQPRLWRNKIWARITRPAGHPAVSRASH